MENNERLISDADARTKMTGIAKETGARYKSIYRCANTRYRHANWYRRVATIPLGILRWTRAFPIVGLVISLR